MNYKIVILILLGSLFGLAGKSMAQISNSASEGFQQNEGQWETAVLYRGAGSGTTVSFLSDGLSFIIGKEVEGSSSSEDDEEEIGFHEEEFEYLIWNVKFKNAQNPVLVPEGAHPGKSNYFPSEDPTHAFTQVTECEALRYEGVYTGINVKYYRQGLQLKYDFLLAPDADVSQIQLAYEGIEGLSVSPRGRLEVETAWGTRSEEKPYAFQMIGGNTVEVECTYLLLNDTTFGFEIGVYDPAYPLVIDPLVLVWSTFAGATVNSSNNYAYDVAIDDLGYVYVCGHCDGSFPVTPTAYDTSATIGQEVAYVRKYTPDGANLVYSTYLGSPTARAFSLEVNDLGEVFVTGTMNGPFPIAGGGFNSIPVGGSGYNVFVTHLNANGDGLIYSAGFGGVGADIAKAIAINASGEATLTGITGSTGFPVTPGAYATSLRGTNDIFVLKLRADGTAPIYSTFLGSINTNGLEEGTGIALDDAGLAVVCGNTLGGTGNSFPTTSGAWQTNTQGSTEGFVAKLNALGNGLVFSTLLTGSAGETALGIELNSRNEPFVTGWTSSQNFPVSPNAVQTTNNGVADAFVVHLTANGDTAIKSTLWGGIAADQPYDLALLDDREAIIFGFSQANGIQTDSCAFQSSHEAGADFFIAHFNEDFTALGEGGSTYFGGMSSDYHQPSIVLDTTTQRTYIVMIGTSHSTNFPTTPGAYQPAKLNQTGDQPVTFKMEIVTPRFLDTLACSLDTVVLDPGPGALHYAWLTGDTTQTISVVGAGDYWANLTYHSCVLRDTFRVRTGVAVALGNDQTVCDVDSLVLTPLNGPFSQYNYQWSTGATSDSLWVQTSGDYWLELGDTLGCSGRDTFQVLMGNTPLIVLPPDTGVCAGNVLTLDARGGSPPPGTRWEWNTGDTLPTITLSAPGTYWVRAYDSVGCTNADTIQFTVYPLPLVDLGPDTSGCDGVSMVLEADPNGNYPQGTFTWNTGAIGPQISVNANGTYIVVLEDSLGCINTDTAVVTFFPFPAVELGPDISRCEGEGPVLLEADPTGQWSQAGFLWSDQSENTTLTVNQTGQYWVRLTGPGGCAVSDSILITLFPQPLVDLQDNLFLCEGDSTLLMLTSTAGVNYLWSTGQNDPSIWATIPGSYWVSAISPEGCESTDSTELPLIPRFELDLGPDIKQCRVEAIFLDPEINGVEWLWSTGSRNAQLTTAEAGVFWVQAENQCQTERDSIEIEFLSDRSYPFIPSAFTPNGDDLNEGFKVIWEDSDQQGFELRIYNRWGLQIFQTIDPNQAWNGTFEGVPVQEGVYVYRFFASDCEGKAFEKTGTITVLR